MKKLQRYKFPKMFLFLVSLLYVVLILVTYFVYDGKAAEACAHRMMVSQGIAFVLQLVLNYVNFKSANKIVVLATLFISAMLFYGVLSAFFKLQLMCKYFGY